MKDAQNWIYLLLLDINNVMTSRYFFRMIVIHSGRLLLRVVVKVCTNGDPLRTVPPIPHHRYFVMLTDKEQKSQQSVEHLVVEVSHVCYQFKKGMT